MTHYPNAGGRIRQRVVYAVCAIALLIFSPGGSVRADDIPIAVLDFELNDLTLNLAPNPANSEEVKRTASLKPLLEGALHQKGKYRIIEIAAEAQADAQRGFGYLFDHHDVAAELGRKYGADWIVVGRNHKASFLFVYFKVHLIATKTQRLVADLTVEVKGQQQKITPKGIERLAEQIDEIVRVQRTGVNTDDVDAH